MLHALSILPPLRWLVPQALRGLSDSMGGLAGAEGWRYA
jgi:hypothetical protein